MGWPPLRPRDDDSLVLREGGAGTKMSIWNCAHNGCALMGLDGRIRGHVVRVVVLEVTSSKYFLSLVPYLFLAAVAPVRGPAGVRVDS